MSTFGSTRSRRRGNRQALRPSNAITAGTSVSQYHLRGIGVVFRLGEEVEAISFPSLASAWSRADSPRSPHSARRRTHRRARSRSGSTRSRRSRSPAAASR
jgi:hypothetical protein